MKDLNFCPEGYYVLNDPEIVRERMFAPYASCREKINGFVVTREGKSFPNSLPTKTYAEFYVNFVDYAFFNLTAHDNRNNIITAILGKDENKYSSKRHIPGSFVEWAAKILNRNKYLTALALGDYLGLKPENCFKRFKINKDFNLHDICTTSSTNSLYPDNICINNLSFELKILDKVHHNSGNIIQHVLTYQHDDDKITVYANRTAQYGYDDAFIVGYSNPFAILPSMHLFYNNQDATVFLCLDPQVSFNFRMLAREVELLKTTGIWVTGFFDIDSDIDAIDWNLFHFRNVVLLVTPLQESWKKLFDVVKKLNNARAESIRIWPWSLLTKGSPTPSFNCLPEAARAVFASQAVSLDDIERPSLLMQRIIEEALDIDELAHWQSSIGLTTPTEHSTKNTDDIDLSDFKKFKDLPDIPIRKLGDPLTLRQLFNPNDITLIWAPSDAGKSFFIQDVVIRMAVGDRFFFLDADNPCNILVLDGEVGDYYKARAKQLTQDGHISYELINNNLTVKYSRGESLLSPEYQKKVMSVIERDNTKVLVIDNLNSNAPEAVDGNPTKLLNYFGVVANMDVSIIMIHHSTKYGDVFNGKYPLATRSQNVMRLYNREQIKELANKDKDFRIPRAVQNMMHDKASAVMMLEFEKCKVAPDLANKRYFFVLPHGGVWHMVDEDQCSSPNDHWDFESHPLPEPETPALHDAPCVAKRQEKGPAMALCGEDNSCFNVDNVAQSTASSPTASQGADELAETLNLPPEHENPTTTEEHDAPDKILAPVKSVGGLVVTDKERYDGENVWHDRLPACPLTPEAVKVLDVMHPRMIYTRRQLQAMLPEEYTEYKIYRTLEMLEKANLVCHEGEGKGRKYKLN